MQATTNRRVLLIDDMPSMHRDFRQTLASVAVPQGLDQLESELFGLTVDTASHADCFEVDSAYQGHDGLCQVAAAVRDGRPYAMAFVDMRMPPGWDGVETIERLWQVDPQLQIVICTAYSDHPWEEVLRRLDVKDRLLIVKKPFDMIEVAQLARTLTAKWALERQAARRIDDLEAAVRLRTEELASAKDAAVAANRDKAEFMNSMNHGIRTPMTAIMGLSYLLLQSELTELQREQLATMHASGDHLMATLDDILDISKADNACNHRCDNGFAAAAAGAATGPARVLLVEDAEINQMIACAFLDKVGIDVDVVNDGQAVIERLDGGAYDLVLMDVYMPILDGMATTRLIRQRAAHQQLPVIGMTASAMPVDRQRCLDAGMNDFLPKPLDFNAVRDVLEKWLPGRLSLSQAPAHQTA